MARSAGDALWAWVREQSGLSLQLDEPCLGMVMDEADLALRDAAYAGADSLGLSGTPLLTVQFGQASPETVESMGARGFDG